MMCRVKAGMGMGPIGFSVEQQNVLRAMWRRGESIREVERTLGETLPRIPAEAFVKVQLAARLASA